MSLLPWKKKRRVSGLAGIASHPDGLAVAKVERPSEDSLPVLKSCHFFSANGKELNELIAEAAEQEQLDEISCVNVMESHNFNLLLVEAPEVDATELRAAVRWRIKDLIDFHIDDAVIDVFDIPAQRSGRAKMMYVVVAKASTVKGRIDTFQQHEAQLEIIDVPELVLRNVAAYLPEDETGVVLLYFDKDKGYLNLTRQGDLYLARIIDFGADQLLREIDAMERDKAAAKESGELVLDEIEEDVLPDSLQRLFDSIVLEIQRSLDYYESHFSLPPVSGVVISPMEKASHSLISYVAGNLGVPVRVMDLNSMLESERRLSDAEQSVCLLAIGAALRQEQKAL